MATRSSWLSTTLPADAGLKRELGLTSATWVSVTSIIGAGWIFGALSGAQQAGGAAVLAWAIGGVAIFILAATHAELGSMFPVAGGTARYPHLAFGGAAGLSFGLFSWLQAVATVPLECYAVMQYAAHYFPGLYDATDGRITRAGFVTTIVLMAVLLAVNFLAVRAFARVNNALTWWKIAIPVLVVVLLLTRFHGSNFTAGGGFLPGGVRALLGALPGASIVFALLGFEQANQLAGEVKNPQRVVPRAILLAVVITATLYVLLQAAFIGAMPPGLLSHGFAAITSTGILSLPFAGVAGLAGLSWLALLVRIDSIISPAATGLIYTAAGSRIGYGLARNRYLPPVFGKVDKNGIPWAGLLLTYIAGVLFLLPAPTWHSLVGMVSSAVVLMYAGVPLSLAAFRRQVPDAARGYRLPNAIVFAPAAFIVADLLIYWSGLEVVLRLGVVLVIGYAIIGGFMAFDRWRPPLHWGSAAWLPVWLIGMGIISWQGQYSGGARSAPVNTDRIPFGWDMLVVAVFSLVIYYWAVAARLPRDEMLSLTDRQADGVAGGQPAG